ncbi:adenosine receptor A2a-like [Glandiceps talaboti]
MAVELFYIVIETIIAVLAVFGNGLVIWVIFRYKRLQTITNYFILSLSVADLLVGALAIPFAILTSHGLPKHFEGCLFMLAFLLWMCASSTFSLIGVSVDRYIAIGHPLRYHAIMTPKSAIAMIAMSWIVSGIIGMLPLMGWNLGRPPEPQCLFMEMIGMDYMFFNFVVAIIIPLLVMVILYGSIFHTAKKQIRSIAALENHNMPKRHGRGGGTWKELKAAKSLAIIIMFFMFCWFPIYVLDTIFLFCTSGCYVPLSLLNFCIFLSHGNSALNPILYGFGRDFRVAYRKVLFTVCPCCRKCFPNQVSDSTTKSVRVPSITDKSPGRGTLSTEVL